MKPHPPAFWPALLVLVALLLQSLPEARSTDYVAVFGPVTVDTRRPTAEAGSLQVNIEPAAAVMDGAQWRREGTTAWWNSGATESGVTAGSYQVEFRAVGGWITPPNQSIRIEAGQTASLDAQYVQPPTITAQPLSQAVPICSDVVFEVKATGTPPLIYQWRFNGSDLEGATNSSLSLSKATVAEAGDYLVTVSNGVGLADSLPATLRLAEPPPVRVASPAEGSSYASGTTLAITATAEDAYGIIRKVEFYADALKLGEGTSVPYGMVWSNLSPGSYSLSVRASGDCGLLSTSAPVRITVTRTNTWPTISPVADVTILEDAPSSAIAFIVADAETSADKLQVVATSSNDALILTTDLTISGAGTNRMLNLKPVADQFGAASLRIVVRDEEGATNAASFVLTVSPVNDPPLAHPDSKVTDEDTQLVFPALDLLSNDSPGPANEGDQTLTVTAVTSPTTQGGKVRLEGTNVVYLPAPQFFGTDSFSYNVTDNGTTAGTSDPQSATGMVVVEVRKANRPPSVALAYPPNNATFIGGTNLTLLAEATDPDGKVTRVEFLSGGSPLGDDALDPYAWVWQDVPPGVYVLSARATDDKGATATSAEITITVRIPDSVPPTVVLTAPTNHTVFPERENISLTAMATGGSDPIAKVEFYAGSLLLGETNVAPYAFVWESPASGDFQLTARAIDRKGLVGESPPIRVAIGTCGGVAIVRSSAHPEIEVLQGYLFELGLKQEVFERAELRATPGLRDRVAALDVLVWEETGGEPLKEEDVLLLQDLVAEGRSLYFIGDGLISAAAGLSETTRQAWYGLLHLEPTMNPVSTETVIVDHEAYRDITLTGRSGTVTNFACNPSADGSRMAYPTGIDAVLGRMGDNDVVVANEYVEHSGRSVTQLLRVYSGVDQQSLEERGKLFENVVWWLMRCPACGAFKIGIRDDGVPESMNLGEESTYGFVVFQTGECGANGVRVVVEVPVSLRFVRASSERGWWSYQNGQVDFFLGRMGSAGEGRLKVTVVPTEPGEVRARATLAASNDFGEDQTGHEAVMASRVIGLLLRVEVKTGGGTQISISGPEGRRCTLQGSFDLSEWQDIKTTELGSNWTTVVDEELPRSSRRFYRAKLD